MAPMVTLTKSVSEIESDTIRGALLPSAMKASSDSMKIVLDPFCGRGTTVAMTLYFGKNL